MVHATITITHRHLFVAGLFLVVLVLMVPVTVRAAGGFTDVDDSNVFKDDIQWMADNGITKGCNPPLNDEFCPKDKVSREQMAAFIHRLSDAGVVDAATLEGATLDEVIAAGILGYYVVESAFSTPGFINAGEGVVSCHAGDVAVDGSARGSFSGSSSASLENFVPYPMNGTAAPTGYASAGTVVSQDQTIVVRVTCSDLTP